jgi:hypothetical protein
LLVVAGIYYVATGVWPLVSMTAFEAVTGPKVDDWLVRMVALLVIVIGGTMLVLVRRGAEHSAEVTPVAGAVHDTDRPDP